MPQTRPGAALYTGSVPWARRYATSFLAAVPTIRFHFEGDNPEIGGSIGHSSFTVTWHGKPMAQVWVAAKPLFSPTQDVFLGYHAIDTATPTMAAQLVADVLAKNIEVEGRTVRPRDPRDFLSRRLFLTEEEYQKSLSAITKLRMP